MAGSYHELSKEPNNAVMFESILQFVTKRLGKPFGTLDPQSVRYSNQTPYLRRPRLWAYMVALYLCVRILVQIIKS